MNRRNYYSNYLKYIIIFSKLIILIAFLVSNILRVLFMYLICIILYKFLKLRNIKIKIKEVFYLNKIL